MGSDAEWTTQQFDAENPALLNGRLLYVERKLYFIEITPIADKN